MTEPKVVNHTVEVERLERIKKLKIELADTFIQVEGIENYIYNMFELSRYEQVLLLIKELRDANQTPS